jgi:hypothetical protein
MDSFKQVDIAVMLESYLLEFLGLNLSEDKGYLDRVLSVVLLSFRQVMG